MTVQFEYKVDTISTHINEVTLLPTEEIVEHVYAGSLKLDPAQKTVTLNLALKPPPMPAVDDLIGEPLTESAKQAIMEVHTRHSSNIFLQPWKIDSLINTQIPARLQITPKMTRKNSSVNAGSCNQTYSLADDIAGKSPAELEAHFKETIATVPGVVNAKIVSRGTMIV